MGASQHAIFGRGAAAAAAAVARVYERRHVPDMRWSSQWFRMLLWPATPCL